MRNRIVSVAALSLVLLGTGACSLFNQKKDTPSCNARSRVDLIKTLRSENIQVIRAGDMVRILIPADSYFGLRDPKLNKSKQGTLNTLAKLLKTYGGAHFYISGYTDEVGSIQHNRLLSHEQAEGIAANLWASGLRFTQINFRGYGDSRTIASNGYPLGSKYNRRVEIRFRVAPNC